MTLPFTIPKMKTRMEKKRMRIESFHENFKQPASLGDLYPAAGDGEWGMMGVFPQPLQSPD